MCGLIFTSSLCSLTCYFDPGYKAFYLIKMPFRYYYVLKEPYHHLTWHVSSSPNLFDSWSGHVSVVHRFKMYVVFSMLTCHDECFGSLHKFVRTILYLYFRLPFIFHKQRSESMPSQHVDEIMLVLILHVVLTAADAVDANPFYVCWLKCIGSSVFAGGEY